MNLSNFSRFQFLSCLYNLLNNEPSVDIFGFPNILPISLSPLGNDILSLGIQNVNVAGRSNYNLHYLLTYGMGALFFDSDKDHPKNILCVVKNRLVGC